MTHETKAKIEAKANEYAEARASDEQEFPLVAEDHIRGATYGYNLAIEEMSTLIDKCEGDIDFLKFMLKENKNETKS